jgi:DNA-binding CsgD family transcriptional regulator
MPLTETQCLQFARFAEAAIQVQSEVAFLSLINDHVQKLLPHQTLFAASGRICFEYMEILHVVPVNYPDVYLAGVQRVFRIRERPAFGHWLMHRNAMVLDGDDPNIVLSERERFEVEVVGQGRLVIHGVVDLSGHMGSFFSFAGVPLTIAAAQAARMMEMLVPPLHTALSRIPNATSQNQALSSLTKIEKQLLGWLAAGRSNLEIAQLRGKSPETVRNQLHRLFSKLQVSSRAEAVNQFHNFKTLQGIALE